MRLFAWSIIFFLMIAFMVFILDDGFDWNNGCPISFEEAIPERAQPPPYSEDIESVLIRDGPYLYCVNLHEIDDNRWKITHDTGS